MSVLEDSLRKTYEVTVSGSQQAREPVVPRADPRMSLNHVMRALFPGSEQNKRLNVRTFIDRLSLLPNTGRTQPGGSIGSADPPCGAPIDDPRRADAWYRRGEIERSL
jgi:hypothetical protein